MQRVFSRIDRWRVALPLLATALALAAVVIIAVVAPPGAWSQTSDVVGNPNDTATTPDDTGGSTNDTTVALTAPSDLNVTATDVSLTLSWGAVTGATGYEVKRSGSTTVATVASGASHPFSGLTANTEYTLEVRAKNNSGGLSPWASTTARTAPAAPGGLTATATSSSLTLTWGAVADARSYEVRLGANGLVATVPVGTSHTIIGLAAGTEHTLNVRAVKRNTKSRWASTTASTMLLAPTGLATSGTYTYTVPSPAGNWPYYTEYARTTLSWNSVAGATGYEITYRPSKGGSGTPPTTTVTVSGTSHTLNDLSGNQSISVRAKNNGGTFQRSSTVFASGGLPVPHRLTVSATSTSLTVGAHLVSGHGGVWSYDYKLGANGAVDEGGYGARRRAARAFSGLAPDTEYTVYGRSSGGGISDWIWVRTRTSPSTAATELSAPSGGKDYTGATDQSTAATGLSAPSGVYAGPSWAPWDNTSLTLSWGAVTGATGYEVKRSGSDAVTTVASGRSYKFTGLAPDTEYTLSVRSKNASGESDWVSLTLSTLP